MRRAERARRSPGISVVLNTYRRPREAARILRQIAAQTLPPDEVILVDDHSPDRAAYEAALRPLRRLLPRLRILRNPRNLGLARSRNRGIRAARFPLVALADDDDEWHRDKLRRQAGVFRREGDRVDLVYTWHRLVDHTKGRSFLFKPRHRGNALAPMLRACFLQPSSVLAKRSALLRAGLFDPAIRTTEDWEMWIRFFRKGFICAPVEAPLVTYHLHAGSKSFNDSEGLLRILRRHLPAFLRHAPQALPTALLGSARRKLGIAKRSLAAALRPGGFLGKAAGVAAARYAVLALGFLTSIVLTRFLGPEGRGLYVSALTVGFIGARLAGLGMAMPSVFLVSRDRKLLPKVLGNILLTSVGAGGATALAAGLLFHSFPATAPVTGWLLFLGLAWIPVATLHNLQENLLIGLHRVRAFAQTEVGAKTFQFAAVLALALLAAPDPSLFLAAVLAVLAGNCLFQFRSLRAEFKGSLEFAPSLIREHIAYALRGQVSAVFALLVVKSDLLVIQYLLGPAATGYYSVASSFADVIPMLPGAVAMLLFPKISALASLRERWKLSRRALKGVLLFLGPFLAAALLAAGPVIRWVYGEAFDPSVRAFQLLLPGLLFLSVQNVAVQTLRSAGHPMGLVAGWVLCFALNLVLNILLIPRFGIEAAAVTSSFCYGLILVLTLSMTRRLLRGHP